MIINGPPSTFLGCTIRKMSNLAKNQLSTLSNVCSKMPNSPDRTMCMSGALSGSLSRKSCILSHHSRTQRTSVRPSLTSHVVRAPFPSLLVSTYPATVHRWLYQYPMILHRDLSLNNIMCRFIEETNAEGKPEQKVYGVLTDYDLSSWKRDLKGDYTKTSQQRTGTPPYMACELLSGKSAVHLYRHDLESLFYVILLLCACHTFGRAVVDGKEIGWRVAMRAIDKIPYAEWFDTCNYSGLGDSKQIFLWKMGNIQLSPPFQDFRPWLEDVQSQFSLGFECQNQHENRYKRGDFAPSLDQTDQKYDNETLGGHISYSSFMESVGKLKEDLKGLIIRYDHKSSSLPTPTGMTLRGRRRRTRGHATVPRDLPPGRSNKKRRR